MLLFLITIALILPLFAAIVLSALALLHLQKRDATPFLAPVLVSCDGENHYMPAGLWHVHRLAATYHNPYSGSEG
jgi:hypothetical protein